MLLLLDQLLRTVMELVGWQNEMILLLASRVL